MRVGLKSIRILIYDTPNCSYGFVVRVDDTLKDALIVSIGLEPYVNSQSLKFRLSFPLDLGIIQVLFGLR